MALLNLSSKDSGRGDEVANVTNKTAILIFIKKKNFFIICTLSDIAEEREVPVITFQQRVPKQWFYMGGEYCIFVA